VGSGDHDDEVDDGPFRDPLPPDDRLWRHPSEIEPGVVPGAAAKRRSARQLLSSIFSRQRG
jgi:hypothetical protein